MSTAAQTARLAQFKTRVWSLLRRTQKQKNQEQEGGILCSRLPAIYYETYGHWPTSLRTLGEFKKLKDVLTACGVDIVYDPLLKTEFVRLPLQQAQPSPTNGVQSTIVGGGPFTGSASHCGADPDAHVGSVAATTAVAVAAHEATNGLRTGSVPAVTNAADTQGRVRNYIRYHTHILRNGSWCRVCDEILAGPEDISNHLTKDSHRENAVSSGLHGHADAVVPIGNPLARQARVKRLEQVTKETAVLLGQNLGAASLHQNSLPQHTGASAVNTSPNNVHVQSTVATNFFVNTSSSSPPNRKTKANAGNSRQSRKGKKMPSKNNSQPLLERDNATTLEEALMQFTAAAAAGEGGGGAKTEHIASSLSLDDQVRARRHVESFSIYNTWHSLFCVLFFSNKLVGIDLIELSPLQYTYDCFVN